MECRDTKELIAYQEGRYGSYEYGRYGNPTTRTLEEKIRVLEGAEDCLVSSSGHELCDNHAPGSCASRGPHCNHNKLLQENAAVYSDGE